MGTCPLTNEQCNNLKSHVVYENINGNMQRLDLCSVCANVYLNTPLTKDEHLEISKIQKENQLEQEDNFNIMQVKDLNEFFEESPKQSILRRFLNFLTKIKNKIFKRKVNEVSYIDKLKRLYYRVLKDQKEDMDNGDIQAAEQKRVIALNIKKSIKEMNLLYKELEFSIIENNDNVKINSIKTEIENIFSSYKDLYDGLFL